MTVWREYQCSKCGTRVMSEDTELSGNILCQSCGMPEGVAGIISTAMLENYSIEWIRPPMGNFSSTYIPPAELKKTPCGPRNAVAIAELALKALADAGYVVIQREDPHQPTGRTS